MTTLNERLRNAEHSAEFLRQFLNCMLRDIFKRDPNFHADIVKALNQKGLYGDLDTDSPIQVEPFVDVDTEGLDFDGFFTNDDD